MRICVVTAGHLSTCPRMLKAADAFAGAGHDVRVVSTRHVDWATDADAEVRRTRRWAWQVVDYSAATGGLLRIRTGARAKAARAGVAALGAERVPYDVALRAFSRVHDELVDAALSAPADFFYGGTTGALAATARAGLDAGVPYAIDLEDFHRGEHDSVAGQSMNAIAARIEGAVLAGAWRVTAAGSAIASEYRRTCGIDAIPINNTFPLPPAPADFAWRTPDRLAMYWFSQTIGPSRGLEDVIRAAGAASVPASLTLRGRPADGFGTELRALAASAAPNLTLSFEAPCAPDRLVDSCRAFDIGLAVEQPATARNRGLALSNKALTYVLAGLALVLTETAGQQAIARDLGAHALVYRAGDIEALAAGLRRWHADPHALAAAKRASWSAAVRRWHWEHPCERGALLGIVPPR